MSTRTAASRTVLSEGAFVHLSTEQVVPFSEINAAFSDACESSVDAQSRLQSAEKQLTITSTKMNKDKLDATKYKCEMRA